MFNGSFGVYELAPLTRAGVASVAVASGVDAKAFVEEVIARRLQPLAMVPMTLRMLLDIAAAGEPLPTEKTDLYERSCLRLCVEPDEGRAMIAPRLMTPTQRLAVAARTAAALLLSGKTSVRLDDRDGDRDTAAQRELAGGQVEDTAVAVHTSATVTTDHIGELVRLPLFSARRERTVGFTQPTYAEFLAARLLGHSRVSMEQVEDLLFAETPSGRRVIPQLTEVGTWLAQIRPEFRHVVIREDPTALLRAEPAGLTGPERESMVEALFSAVSRYELDPNDHVLLSSLHHLAHPGLAAQVRRVVLDPDADVWTREIALELAGRTRLCELTGIVRKLTRERSVPVRLRVDAISALAAIGSDADMRALRPLALNRLGDEDPDDDIKGAALRTLWPRHLTGRQVFGALTQPTTDHYVGIYNLFLMQNLFEHLTDEDLPVGLQWAKTVPVAHHQIDSLSRVRDELIKRSLPLSARADIARPLAGVIAVLLRERAELVERPLFPDREPPIENLLTVEIRRRLILLLAPRIARSELHESALVHSSPPIATPQDADWVVEQLDSARGHLAIGLAHLTKALIWLGAFPDRIDEARARNRLLRDLTADYFDAVCLESPEADRMRTTWAKWQEISALRNEDNEPKVDVRALVQEQMPLLLDGDLDAYWRAVLFTSVDPVSGRIEMFKSRLADLPGWSVLDPDSRQALRDSAMHYILDRDPEPRRWFARGTGWRPAWAGYRALREIRDNGMADHVPSQAWARWAPVVVDWRGEGNEEQAFNAWALDRCSREAPASTAEWIGAALDRDLREHHHPFILGRLSPPAQSDDRPAPVAAQMWSAELERQLMRRATRSRLEPKARALILDFLVRRGSAAAHEHAVRLVSVDAIRAGGRRRALAEPVAALLAAELPGAAWVRLWPLIRQFPKFGDAVLTGLAVDRERSITGQLSERQVADLWEWMLVRFPPSGDGHQASTHRVGPREQVGSWRDNLVRSLVDRGSDEAVSELCRLRDCHPELHYLQRYAANAAENRRRRTWIAPPPQVIVQMADDAARRWVKSSAELRRVVAAVISRLEKRLQEGHQSLYLWNEHPRRPKHEPAISRYIQLELQRELDERGVVTGRETEVRPHPDSKMGESADVLVSARAGEYVVRSELVEVVVEVKGCWHNEVMNALRTQLIDRYLTNTGIVDGVYVVGWFAADDWDPEDRRNFRCARCSPDQLRRTLDQQAREESAATDTSVDAVVLDCSIPPRRDIASRARSRRG